MLRNEEMRRSRAVSETVRLPLGPFVAPASAWATAPIPFLFVVCAIGAALAPWSPWMRGSLALGLVALGAAIHRALGRRRKPPAGWLVADEEGLHRIERTRGFTLVKWQEPFGLTVFASADRVSLRIVVTSADATRYVPAWVRDAEDAASAPTVIARAATVVDGDLRGDNDLALSASDAEKLLNEVTRRVPEALDRLFLSDPSGEPVVLDRAELRVGTRRIDLRAPLEWRASIFQELGVHAVSICQATWVRQADIEVVLVAPVSAESASAQDPGEAVRAAGEGPSVRRSLARDLRLMQGALGEPPPRELRRAIDRPFMLPLRRALDRAPRVTRTSLVGSRPTAGTP